MADGQSTELVETSTALRERAMSIGMNTHGLAPRSLSELMDFAQVMAKAGPMVGKAFRQNPGACVAVTMQAMRWHMDPFAVSQKAYVTVDKFGNEHIGYEAQLINAVILSNAPMVKRPQYTFSGSGNKRRCKVAILLRGEDSPLEYETPEQTPDGNSPLWKKDLDQQLSYYAIRSWARRHMPELIMGVYTPDELQDAIPVEARIIDRGGEHDQRPADERGEFVKGAAAQQICAAFTARMEAAENGGDIDAIFAEFVSNYRGRISNNLIFGMEEVVARNKDRILVERMSRCGDLAELEELSGEMERAGSVVAEAHYEACAEALAKGEPAPPAPIKAAPPPRPSPFEALSAQALAVRDEAGLRALNMAFKDKLGQCAADERGKLQVMHVAAKQRAGKSKSAGAGGKNEGVDTAGEPGGVAHPAGAEAPSASSFEDLKQECLACLKDKTPRKAIAAWEAKVAAAADLTDKERADLKIVADNVREELRK